MSGALVAAAAMLIAAEADPPRPTATPATTAWAGRQSLKRPNPVPFRCRRHRQILENPWPAGLQ